MPALRTLASLRTAATLLGATLLVPLLSACPKADVGAPCNHGDVQPPDSKVVTFPALSCNDLLCVYADDSKAPTIDCAQSSDCNTAEPDKNRFACINKSCKLNSTYVLERSMCSRTCASDSDCADGGIGKKVLADDSTCKGGFQCAQIQKLGEFCCQKLCVCKDDLSAGTIEMVNNECEKLKGADGEYVCDEMEMPGATTAPATMTM